MRMGEYCSSNRLDLWPLFDFAFLSRHHLFFYFDSGYLFTPTSRLTFRLVTPFVPFFPSGLPGPFQRFDFAQPAAAISRRIRLRTRVLSRRLASGFQSYLDTTSITHRIRCIGIRRILPKTISIALTIALHRTAFREHYRCNFAYHPSL